MKIKNLNLILFLIGLSSFLLISTRLLTTGTKQGNLPSIIYIIVFIFSTFCFMMDLKKRYKVQRNVIQFKLKSLHSKYLTLASLSLFFCSMWLIPISRPYKIPLIAYCLLLSAYIFTLSQMKSGICKDGVICLGVFIKLSEIEFTSINKETKTLNIKFNSTGRSESLEFEEGISTQIEEFFAVGSALEKPSWQLDI